jgi:CBS domain-containing protein
VRALGKDPDGKLTVVEAGSTDLIVTSPDEPLRDAVVKMLQNNIGTLIVVSRLDERQFLGYLGRSRVMSARLLQLDE